MIKDHYGEALLLNTRGVLLMLGLLEGSSFYKIPVLTPTRQPYAYMWPLSGWALTPSGYIYVYLKINRAVQRACALRTPRTVKSGSLLANRELFDHLTAVTASHGS